MSNLNYVNWQPRNYGTVTKTKTTEYVYDKDGNILRETVTETEYSFPQSNPNYYATYNS